MITDKQRAFARKMSAYVHTQDPRFAEKSKTEAVEQGLYVILDDPGAFEDFLGVLEANHRETIIDFLHQADPKFTGFTEVLDLPVGDLREVSG